jgi:hypothetical protein
MTKEEIIELARQAGFVDYELDDGTTNAFDVRYEAFAKLVVAKEQDRICRQIASLHDSIMLASHSTLTKKGKA